VAAAGTAAAWRFLEFFSARIRNPHTRRAYHHAALAFFAWAEGRGLDRLEAIRPHHVAAYLEALGRARSAPTVKQHLAALRMLFDWLVLGQIVTANPAAAVRGPSHVVRTGLTPVLQGAEARALLDSIPDGDLLGRRDRALIGVLVYGFARIGAALAMDVGDVQVRGRRLWLGLHEKGGRRHAVPAHHELEAFLDAYLAAAGGTRETPLFRSARGRAGGLGPHRLQRRAALRMVKRRAAAAGIRTPVGCHTFRATGITAYLGHGGSLEVAQALAGHESPRTTRLYDRRGERISQAEIERIRLA